VHREAKTFTKKSKAHLMIAVILLVVASLAVVSYAWFNNSRQLVELQAIHAPDLLFLTSANAEDVDYFDLSSVSVVDDQNHPITTPKLYPFGVAGKYVSSFTLQLAHTTNNPFIYTIYNADAYATKSEALSAASGDESKVIEYDLHGAWDVLAQNDVILNGDPRPFPVSNETIYLVQGSQLNGSYLNDQTVDGRKIATNKYHDESYGAYNNRTVYEEALYWQCSGIPSVAPGSQYVGRPFMKTFILKVTWKLADVTSGKIANDKETDIVYVAAFR